MRSALALLAAAAALLAVAAREAPRKKLIEWGWDEPDTAFLRAHVRELEATPFDGCVFHVIAAGGANLAWRAWGTQKFSEAELEQAAQDLRQTRFTRFRSNFLRMNVTPADLDWYDDHQALLQNARLLARLARLGGAGIALDTEQYQGKLFEYERQRDAGRRSFADYAAQARRRGRELMRALEEGYPGLTLLLSFGPSYPYLIGTMYQLAPARNPYGLLLPFVDGLLEGAGEAVIVDGHEPAYWFKQPEQFARAYRTMSRELLSSVADPDRYRRHVSFGFGIWMDYDWRSHGWSDTDVGRNYFTPDALYAAARAALRRADEYVWIYSEQPRWWSASGRVKLPSAYDEALVRAKREGAGRARRPR